MPVVDLAQERLVRAMVDVAAAASTGDSQQLNEKAQVLEKVIQITDEETIRRVTSSNTPSVSEVVEIAVKFLQTLGDIGRLIEKFRR
jgi:hypothetical protein